MILKGVELDNNFFGEMRHRTKSEQFQRIQSDLQILPAEECGCGGDKHIELITTAEGKKLKQQTSVCKDYFCKYTKVKFCY